MASTTTMQELSIKHKLYPKALRAVHNPPNNLFVRGTIQDKPLVALVGSRKPTAYGEAVAYRIAADLARAGVGIVSGLAYGIDATVHRGALEAGGYTIAVLGSGLDTIYPRQHAPLAREIVRSGGAVISEYPAGTPPLKHHFPARNRIIAGICLATIVIEAEAKSGSLITAKLALEENRVVGAVPGPITSTRSNGPHYLLKEGALVVTSAADILSELDENLIVPARQIQTTGQLSALERNVIEALSNGPLDSETLAARTKLEISELLAHLTLLEMNGIVRPVAAAEWALVSS